MTLSDILGSPAVEQDTVVTIVMTFTASAGDLKADEGRVAEMFAEGVWKRQARKYQWDTKNGLTVQLG